MSEQRSPREAGRGALRGYAWLVFAGGGAVLLALGVMLGEPAKIFEKATAICLQCIGIG
ncbi:MAG TPA: CD1871A family CXXC motif-containing protein [Candidatus Ozemobacteraceae bacterium]|nr:CD1871A family CXXC motif-containing protein [Candidatus Ozemobacteraceae bacterium]HQG27946.1 CD1871A family CXXC motif-containing protein [Candidatus Ozemobacteraceae bacterium]